MITRHHANKRLSAFVEFPLAGTQVVVSGQVADNPKGDIKAQTRDVLDKIDRYLAEAGTDKTAVAYAYIWLPNILDFDSMNEVWDGWVPAGHAPARACVEARLANPDLRVEIQVVAVKA